MKKLSREELLAHFEKNAERSLTEKELLRNPWSAKTTDKHLRRLLRELTDDGLIDRDGGHRFRKARPRPNGSGRGGQGGGRGGRGGRGGDRRPEARGPASAAKTPIGLYREVGKARFIEPEGGPRRGRAPAPFIVAKEHSGGAEDGFLVEFEILRAQSATETAHARVTKVLGRPGDRETEIQHILRNSGIPLEFDGPVLTEARAFPEEVTAADREGREDLRPLAFVTIDGADARDFDDAVCVEKTEHGFRLYVAIADVAHYVREGRPLDTEAMTRGTSVYLPDRVVPMLPEELSNHLCSLRPKVDRLAFVAEMLLDGGGALLGSRFYKAVIRSQARLTYDQVALALDGQTDDTTGPLLPAILRLYKVAQLLLARRLKRGAIDLDIPESQVMFDADGFPVDVVRRERNDAHRLIEDLMLAANEAVAQYFVNHGLPTVFRVHEDPDPLRLEAFLELAATLGISVPKKKKKLHPKDVALLLEQLNENPRGKPLNTFLLRSLAQARYYPTNEGHFGLAAEHYLHFTSPIRRYPDLMVHRLLERSLAKERSPYSMAELTEIAQAASEAERRAMEVERAAKDLDRALVATAHLGEELEGRISGIQGFGAFVLVNEPFIEGLVPVQHLGDDYFEPDKHLSELRGQRTGKVWRIGDPIRVIVAAVRLERRQVELHPVGSGPTPEQGRRHPKPAKPHKTAKDAAGKPPKRRGGRRRRGRVRA